MIISYLTVISSFKIYIAVGSYVTNTFFGSSRACGISYRSINLVPGDEVHDIFGGVFVVHEGKAYQAKMKLSEKHPFEKTYGMTEEIFPLENLSKITSGAKVKYSMELPNIDSPKKYYGRSIDSVEL